MNSKKKNIEAQIVEDFEKIRPAITRLLQTQMKNDDLSLRYGRSKSNSKNDIVINPSILVNTISKTNLDRDEVMIGTVVHEAIHATNNYSLDSESLNKLFPDELDDVEDIEMELYKCCMSNYFGIGLGELFLFFSSIRD